MATTLETNILRELERELRRCPRCRTLQKLHRIRIQKKVAGGKFGSENQAVLCAPCDEDWRRFAAENKLEEVEFPLIKARFGEFLETPVDPAGYVGRRISVLKEVAGLRLQIAVEKVRYEGRFRSRSRRLDVVFPIEESPFADEGHESWMKLLLSEVAEVKGLKHRLDRIIAEKLQDLPVWEYFLKNITGIGPYLGGFLIGTIGSVEGWWCEHTFHTQKYSCDICSDEDRTIKRYGVRAFPSTADLFGYAGLGVTPEGRAEPKARGASLGYDPVLKIVVVQLIPQSFTYQRSRFPESPYSLLLKEVETKVERNAISTNPQKCLITNCEETDIVNLGFKTDPKEGEVFMGFCCRKTLHTRKPHKFLNPAHRRNRIFREVGKKFFSDFYHAWLWFEGENPQIQTNPRIMEILRSGEK